MKGGDQAAKQAKGKKVESGNVVHLRLIHRARVALGELRPFVLLRDSTFAYGSPLPGVLLTVVSMFGGDVVFYRLLIAQQKLLWEPAYR